MDLEPRSVSDIMKQRRTDTAVESPVDENSADGIKVDQLHERLRRRVDVFTSVLELLRQLKSREPSS